ncbi:MAG: AAA family ATPase [Pseudomonadota bacterium]|nr:AAA family ATPase [Pseudomonadota bacterium]
MNNKLYSLIMHHDDDFWETDDSYVDFPRNRFLEYTESHIVEEFKTLNEVELNKIKDIPVLFATEHESSETKMGKITNIELLPRDIRIHFKFDKKPALFKGSLHSPDLNIASDGYELYRTHWAIKECDLFDFYDRRSKSLEGMLDRLKVILDNQKNDKANVVNLYAYNGSGKTRISRFFQDAYDEELLCYNALMEDCFSWDNEAETLNLDTDSWVFKLIKEQEIDGKITENFTDLIDDDIEPRIDFRTGEVYFDFVTGDEKSRSHVKVSRGEESLFIWSVFYSILENAIETLEEEEENRPTDIFNNKKYIIIDDPVSSMDDGRIISVALKIMSLIEKSKGKFSFLITSHHPLFFNVFFNKKTKKWNRFNYTLRKSGRYVKLEKQSEDSPFAYHHGIISELEDVIESGTLKRYHFNLLRALLEKFSNFLGYGHWKKCLEGIDTENDFLKLVDHYSHDRLSEMEFNDLIDKETKVFTKVFQQFCAKYKLGANND